LSPTPFSYAKFKHETSYIKIPCFPIAELDIPQVGLQQEGGQ
jgi:hypothetical protein